MVECDLAKVEVAGSTPVSRSSFFLFFTEAITPIKKRILNRRNLSSKIKYLTYFFLYCQLINS